jgi:hypothetical protein
LEITMPLLTRLAWAGVAALAACGPATDTATAPEELLALLPDTVDTPFGQVPVAVAMTPGRWMVVAPDWDTAVVADFATRTTAPLGAGPGRDFQRPVDLFAAGDSIYLADWGMRRLTIWSRVGQLLGEIPSPTGVGTGFPKARDGAGRWYFELPLVAGRDGSGLRDSAAIIRTDPAFGQIDTVLRLSPPDVLEVTRDDRPRFERAIFGGQDRWGVLPDGTTWVARIARNRVTWIGPDGSRQTGPGLPDPVYEVTEYDRESFLAQFPPDLRSSAATLPFALVKPPFERVFTGPDGLIWQEKTKAGLDSLRRVHVVDREGRLARILAIPTRGSIIAVGDSTLLIAEQWREGVRLLQARVRR